MNQLCRVCAEPAAGFHFGAFTCEGCKSFFGRTCNNVSSLGECKNGGSCIITRKNRTACKSCRLRKCLGVGMSKSGSRYGRRSNWFKIHCLLQDQQSNSDSANEKAHSILEDMHMSKLKVESGLENNSNGEEAPEEIGGSSSPTVTSSDANDPHFPAEAPVGLNLLNWLSQTNGTPPEALSVFAALSPFLMTPGIGSQAQINAANFAQYYPYLISLLSGRNNAASLDQPNISISPFSLPSSDSTTEETKESASSSSPNLNDYKPIHVGSSLFHQQEKHFSINSSLDCFRVKSVNSRNPNHTNTNNLEIKQESERLSPTAEGKISKGKNLYIERMQHKPLISLESIISRKRRLSEDERTTEEVNLGQSIVKRLQKKFIQDLQSEPIDLSVKSLSSKSTSIPPTSCASLLACSMTLTPISSYNSSPISDEMASTLDASTDLTEERSASAIDLSCRG